jgi:hypothetical protein
MGRAYVKYSKGQQMAVAGMSRACKEWRNGGWIGL